MHCYFNLVSPHQSIIDEEGIAVADADEARTFAREAVTEMVQDGVAEIAHWRGWEGVGGRSRPGMPPEPSYSRSASVTCSRQRAKERRPKPASRPLQVRITRTITAKQLNPSPMRLWAACVATFPTLAAPTSVPNRLYERGKSDCLDVRVSSFRSSSPEVCILIGNQSWLACRHEMPKQGADPPHGRQVPQASA